ncbi:hypothetical protein PENSPDRAFT_602068 [Peniophora sp. CONT]|nr:hypothetical protein PENSPDRAFT_602068 [Peniophora sp. CONT]
MASPPASASFGRIRKKPRHRLPSPKPQQVQGSTGGPIRPTRPSTPVHGHVTHSTTMGWDSGIADAARAALLADHPTVTEYDFDQLCAAYLHGDTEPLFVTRPNPLPHDPPSLESLYDRLESGGFVVDGHWAYDLVPEHPGQAAEHETIAFAFLSDVYDCVLSEYTQLEYARPRTLKLISTTGNAIPSSSHMNTARPDGYIALEASVDSGEEDLEGSYDFFLFGGPLEVKKKKSKREVADNNEKVVCHMHHIMRNDARRRFIFGLTMENRSVRLWHHNRSTVAVSTALDIHDNWRDIARLFILLGTSTPTELGYDSTVRLLPSRNLDDTPRYEIDVHDSQGVVTYVAVQRISDKGADAITGRATRVWKVINKADWSLGRDGPYHVLKDHWPNDNREVEGILLDEIRSKLSNHPAQRHFLTRLHDGMVPVEPFGATDHTSKTIARNVVLEARRTLDISLLQDVESKPATTSSKGSGGSKGVPSIPKLDGARVSSRRGKPSQDEPRWHYRIVFDEVGEVLTDLTTYDHVFFALQGTLCALRAMHSLHYIHRDVSAHNILIVDRGEVEVSAPCNEGCPCDGEDYGTDTPVIMDLEFVENLDLEVGKMHLMRTGTWPFAAFEVAKGDYAVLFQSSGMQTGPFRQHALHDNEPTFWIALWLVLRSTPFKMPYLSTESAKAAIASFNTLFPSPPHFQSRSDAFHYGHHLETHFQHVVPEADATRNLLRYFQRWIDIISSTSKEAYEQAFGCGAKFGDKLSAHILAEYSAGHAISRHMAVLESMRGIVLAGDTKLDGSLSRRLPKLSDVQSSS